MNKFNIELIQAINDWQASGFGGNKKRIVDEILKYTQSVPERFKNLPSPCYRRVDLTGKYNLQIGLKLSLPEAESSCAASAPLFSKIKNKNSSKRAGKGIP